MGFTLFLMRGCYDGIKKGGYGIRPPTRMEKHMTLHIENHTTVGVDPCVCPQYDTKISKHVVADSISALKHDKRTCKDSNKGQIWNLPLRKYI